MEQIRVSASSNPKSVAGAIAARLQNFGELEVNAVGAKAVNQAVKSLIIARIYCKKDNIDLIVRPDFYTANINGSDIVSIKMHTKRVPLAESES